MSRVGDENGYEADRSRVQGILHGDPSAFTEFYEQFRPRVFGFILKRVRCPAEAEDLTQETFALAYRSFAAFEGRSSLSTWLFGIANNVCRRAHRNASRWMIGSFRAHPLDDLLVGLDPRIERRIDARRTLARFDSTLASSLSESQQQIFRLRYGENRSIRSIARELGKSSDAVKASLRRTRTALARQVPELQEMLLQAA